MMKLCMWSAENKKFERNSVIRTAETFDSSMLLSEIVV